MHLFEVFKAMDQYETGEEPHERMTICDIRQGNLDDEFRLLCLGHCVEPLEPTDDEEGQCDESDDTETEEDLSDAACQRGWRDRFKDVEPVTHTIHTAPNEVLRINTMSIRWLMIFAQSLQLKVMKYTGLHSLVLAELDRKMFIKRERKKRRTK